MQNVTLDRHLFIGGSDIPAVMGISPFKTRYDLLLEKAQLKENDFSGNEYTEYGNIMEAKIRDYLNLKEKNKYLEDKVEKGDLRYHSDGFNGERVLEIKTTSRIYTNVNDYKVYLVQLLTGMKMHDVNKGVLAVYNRPDDFDEKFNASNLFVYDIDIANYLDLILEIDRAIEQFRIDLAKIKANPFLTEEELQPQELVELANKVVALEKQITTYKNIDAQYKELKSQLYEQMSNHNIKKWATKNGVQITKVDGTCDAAESVETFNTERFKKENEALYKEYLETRELTKKGRAGYVKITLTKE